jgi:hypothetical protein
MTPSEVYAALLQGEGLLVEDNGDGILNFKYEGDSYELLTYADDRQYVGVRTTYRLPDGVRRPRALAVANDQTRKSKVVKVYLLPTRGVTIAAEAFVGDPQHLHPVMLRVIRTLDEVAANYFAQLAAPTGAPA